MKVVALRGRLVRRMGAWDEATRESYSRMCVERAHALVAATPALRNWAPPPAIGLWEAARLGFIAARIAQEAGGTEAYLDERRRQAGWLSERLGID